MSDLIKVGSSGVRVNQSNLNVTGHNIANVDTDGYSRQDAMQITNSSIALGYGHQGQGARTETIRRITDDFMIAQLRNDTSLAKDREMLLDYAKQLDSLLADSSSSPGNALNEFFSAMQSLADDPNNMTLRNQVLAQSDSLSQRFNLLQERFDDMQESVNVQLKSSVGDINRLAANVADLNKNIIQAENRNSQPANDLRDQRDEQLRLLSEYADVSVSKADDGSFTVSLGKGFPLVVGGSNYELSANNLSSDSQRLGIMLKNKLNEEIDVTSSVKGGELGGVLRFRDEVMTPAQNEIGRLALTIGETFNAQHKLGINLNNELGGNFFKDANTSALMSERAFAYLTNDLSSDLKFNVNISDTNALTGEDYVLKATATGGPFSLFDTQGNPIAFQGTATPNTATLAELSSGGVSVDGFTLSLASGVSVAQGDKFLIQPTRYAAGDIERDIASPEELAIASPLRFEPHLANSGSGEMRDLKVTETFSSSSANPNSSATGEYAFVDQLDGSLKMYQGGTVQSLAQGLEIYYTGETSYEVRDASDSTKVLHAGTYTQGIEQDMLPADWGIQFRLGGNPDTGDSFKLSFNKDGFGDNSNALRLTALQGEPTLEGDMSYQDAYAKTVTQVASQTSEAKITALSGAMILEQTKNLRDSVSGVNLDEEAANLVRFQQAYNASSQLISTAKQLFDTLLAAVR